MPIPLATACTSAPTDQVERTVEFPQQFLGELAFHPEHDPVRAHKVADGGTLAQELRIGSDIEIGLRIFFLDLITRHTCRAVPTGTVDLSTMTV
jgi:hypothetical protein